MLANVEELSSGPKMIDGRKIAASFTVLAPSFAETLDARGSSIRTAHQHQRRIWVKPAPAALAASARASAELALHSGEGCVAAIVRDGDKIDDA
jgi:hypothetical protein